MLRAMRSRKISYLYVCFAGFVGGRKSLCQHIFCAFVEFKKPEVKDWLIASFAVPEEMSPLLSEALRPLTVGGGEIK